MSAQLLQQAQALLTSSGQAVANWLEQLPGGESDEWQQPVGLLVALALFGSLLVSLGDNGYEALNKPITEVRINGPARHLNREQFGEALAQELSQSYLLRLDVNSLQERIEEEPWIRRASVELKWPGAVELQIQEEVPVARWGDKGLLNQQGDIFWPELKAEYRGLPQLSGPARDTAKVMARFHELNQLLRQVGLNIEGLQLEARGAWTLMLDNGIRVIVGRQAEEERLARFLKVYQAQLAERAADIEQVDIRYSNGIAVRWRPAVANDEKQINDGNGQ